MGGICGSMQGRGFRSVGVVGTTIAAGFRDALGRLRKSREKVLKPQTARWLRILPDSNEAHLPAKETQAGEDPRIPFADEHQGWPRDHPAAPSQGPQAARSLSMAGSGAGSPRRRRLSRSGDFKRAYREGTSKATRYLVLYRFDRPEDESNAVRLGVSVSKKLGDAVSRNRVKRVLKEAFWSRVDRDRGEQDYVLVARPGVGKVIDEQGLAGAVTCVDEVLGEQPGDLAGGDEGGRST